MGNGNSKGLSVNAKTIILLILFLDVGFTFKMIHKYNDMKDAGFVREKNLCREYGKKGYEGLWFSRRGEKVG